MHGHSIAQQRLRENGMTCRYDISVLPDGGRARTRQECKRAIAGSQGGTAYQLWSVPPEQLVAADKGLRKLGTPYSSDEPCVGLLLANAVSYTNQARELGPTARPCVIAAVGESATAACPRSWQGRPELFFAEDKRFPGQLLQGLVVLSEFCGQDVYGALGFAVLGGSSPSEQTPQFVAADYVDIELVPPEDIGTLANMRWIGLGIS